MKPASIKKRIVAFLIDTLLFGLIWVPVLLIFYRDSLTNLSQEFRFLGPFLSSIYSVFLPYYWNGQTIGKKLLSIRIKPVNKGKLTLKLLVVRYLSFNVLYSLIPILYRQVIMGGFVLNIIDWSYMIGYVIFARWNKLNQMPHDVIAKTKVVQVNK